MVDPFATAVDGWLDVASNGVKSMYYDSVQGEELDDVIVYIDPRVQLVDDLGSVSTRGVAIFSTALLDRMPSTKDYIVKDNRTWEITGYAEELSDVYYHAVYIT